MELQPHQTSWPNFILLLGAGASKEFDIPLFSEIHEPFLKDTKDKHTKRVRRIKKELDKIGFSSDIENYISYARGQVKPRDTILTMNPYVAYFVYRTMHPLVSYGICRSRVKNVGKDPSAKLFLDDLEEYIYDTLFVHDIYKKNKIISHYDRFFVFLQKRFGINHKFEVDIFTTNYDDAIELYSEERYLDLFDGFNETPDGISSFDPDLYKLHDIRLYKLHGSVRLGVVKDNSNNSAYIHSKRRIAIGETYKGAWKLAERMMLLGHDKDVTTEPFFELLKMMKEQLMHVSTCIAIGYSFSTGPILNVFKDVMRHRSDDFELILLCKNADEVKTKQFSDDPRVRAIKDVFSKFEII